MFFRNETVNGTEEISKVIKEKEGYVGIILVMFVGMREEECGWQGRGNGYHFLFQPKALIA